MIMYGIICKLVVSPIVMDQLCLCFCNLHIKGKKPANNAVRYSQVLLYST